MFTESAFREHTSPKVIVWWFYAYVLHFQKKNTNIYLLDKCRNAFQKITQDPEALIIFVTEKMDLPYQNKKNTVLS